MSKISVSVNMNFDELSSYQSFLMLAKRQKRAENKQQNTLTK